MTFESAIICLAKANAVLSWDEFHSTVRITVGAKSCRLNLVDPEKAIIAVAEEVTS